MHLSCWFGFVLASSAVFAADVPPPSMGLSGDGAYVLDVRALLRLLEGWAMNTSTGEARADVTKRTKLPVRLVLPLD